MSRHVLRADEDYTVVIGYDDALDSFFAQVFDEAAMRREPDGPEILLVNTGENPQEVTDAMACLASVRDYLPELADVKKVSDLELPEFVRLGEVVVALVKERVNRRQPTEFQRKTFRDLLGGELP